MRTILQWIGICCIPVALFLHIKNSDRRNPQQTIISKPKTGRLPTKTDYQINIHMDTIWLYDGSRLVGRVLNTWDSPLDSLILKDNN